MQGLQANRQTNGSSPGYSTDATVEELQIAIENSMTGISWLDANGIYRSVRNGYSNLLGYEPGELEGKSWKISVPPEEVVATENAFASLVTASRVVHETTAVRKDGTQFFKQILLVKTTDEAGNHNGHYCFMRDISDRKNAETAQLHYQEFSSQLLDSIQDGLSVLDENFTHIRVNEAFCKMTGYTEEELIGSGVPHSYWPEEHYEHISDLIQKGRSEVKNIEIIFRHKNGKRFPVIVSPFMSKDAKGNQIYVATIKDISEIRESNRRIADSDRLKTIGTLAGGIAHDLNNLLTPILGSADVVLRGGADTSKATEVIHAAAERAKELIEQLLQFSSPHDTEQSEVSVEKALRDAIQFVQGSLPANVSLNTKTNLKNDLVIGVEARIQLLILNLLSNAGDAMQDSGGNLSINLHNPDGEHIQLEIQDSGCGISQKYFDTIFDAFYTTKAPSEGTGLGLLMVKETVNDFGGTVSVESTVGEGSLFTVRLPLSVAISSSADAADNKELIANPLRIMVVDDDSAILEVSKIMLDHLGHQSTCFNNPIDALKQNKEDYDLVITDYRMNGISGLEFVEKIEFDGPVLLMTGLYELDENLPNRIDGKLNKPFKLNNLKDAIDAIT